MRIETSSALVYNEGVATLGHVRLKSSGYVATPCVLTCTAYFVLCTVYLLVGVNRRKQWQKAILKCSPLILLLIFSWSYGSSSDRGNVEHSNNHWLLLHGLIFSCVGDGLLVFRTHLGLFGIISFAINLHCMVCLDLVLTEL